MVCGEVTEDFSPFGVSDSDFSFMGDRDHVR